MLNRVYPLKSRITFPDPETNVGKLRQLDELHAKYVQYVGVCVAKMVIDRRVNVFPSERRLYFPDCPELSSQILKNAQAQAIELVSTWVAGLYGRTLKSHIRKQSLPELETLQLYTIGKYKLAKSGKFGKGTISQELVDLYWSWIWDPEVSGNPPTIGDRTPMQLTEMTCDFEGSSKSTHFKGWWLNCSTLTRKKRIEIPLKVSPYLKSAASVALSVLARKSPDGEWVFQFTERNPETESTVFDGSAGKIGVDVGLNVLAATSDGTLYGQSFKRKFDHTRKHTQNVRANRQRQGFKADSRRLWKLERKLSGQIKTVTGEIANKLVTKYPKHTFVVEDLDLSGCKGSKRFAYRALQTSLASKAVTQKVNPAYSSQSCPSCGSVNRKNRHGTSFACRSCGRKAHADFVGGFNLLGRSEDKQIKLSTPVKSVKAVLESRYRSNRSRPPRFPLVGARTVEPVAYYERMPSGHARIATNMMEKV